MGDKGSMGPIGPRGSKGDRVISHILIYIYIYLIVQYCSLEYKNKKKYCTLTLV